MKRRSNYQPAHPDAQARLDLFDRTMVALNNLEISRRRANYEAFMLETEWELI